MLTARKGLDTKYYIESTARRGTSVASTDDDTSRTIDTGRPSRGEYSDVQRRFRYIDNVFETHIQANVERIPEG